MRTRTRTKPPEDADMLTCFRPHLGVNGTMQIVISINCYNSA